MIVWMYRIGFEAMGPGLCQSDVHTGSQSTLRYTLLVGPWRQLECVFYPRPQIPINQGSKYGPIMARHNPFVLTIVDRRDYLVKANWFGQPNYKENQP